MAEMLQEPGQTRAGIESGKNDLMRRDGCESHQRSEQGAFMEQCNAQER